MYREMQAFSVDIRQLNGRVPSVFNAKVGCRVEGPGEGDVILFVIVLR